MPTLETRIRELEAMVGTLPAPRKIAWDLSNLSDGELMRLRALLMKVGDSGDLSKLSDDELMQLERLATKAGGDR